MIALISRVHVAPFLLFSVVGHVHAQLPERISREVPNVILGTWRQLDDGRYLQVHRECADFFDYTRTMCYKVAPDSGKPLGETYVLYLVSEDGSTLKLWKHDFGDRFERFYWDEFVRVDNLPDNTILNAAADDRFKNPAFVAKLICQHFDEHFPFFVQRKFDWQTRKQLLLDSVTERTTDRELFSALRLLLTGLGDSHTRIYWAKEQQPYKSGQTRVLAYLEHAFAHQSKFKTVSEFGGHWQAKVRREIETLLVDDQLNYAANERIRWGILDGNIGYIENEFLNGFAPQGTSRAKEVKILSDEIDRVINGLRDCRALIIDLSYNAGGYDQAALTIASRFADRRRHVMTYSAPGMPAGSDRKCFVRPLGGLQFTKPVYVLTSNSTVSAGETLTLALKAFPHVRHVGEPTRGCISSFLNKWMPNDFHLTLSNQIWMYPDGTVPEGIGLQPDIPIPVFTKDDFFGSYPKAIRTTKVLIDDKY